MTDSKDKNKELKEIEDSLFEEFNEQVRLTEPTDSRLHSSVDLNPSILVSNTNPEEAEESQEKQQQEVNVPVMESGDLAEKEAPVLEYSDKAEDIDLSAAFNSAVAKDIAISKEEAKEADLGSSPKGLVGRIRYALAAIKEKQIPSKTFKLIKLAIITALYPVRWSLRLSGKQKSYFLLIVFTLSALIYFSYDFYDRFTNPVKHSQYVLSFQEVESTSYVFAEDEVREAFFSPAYTPDYAFIIPKVIVNLKPSANSSATPMLFVEFVLKASNQQTAIEFKDRQIEIQDLVARTIEEYDYDTMKDLGGKEAVRKDIIRNVNPLLNNGIVIDALYKSFILKP